MKYRLCFQWAFICAIVFLLTNPAAKTQTTTTKRGQGMLQDCAAVPLSSRGEFRAAARLTAPNIAFFKDAAVILEYDSIDDVHTVWDSLNYPDKRLQSGHFDWDRILQDLETVIDPANYSFVALYTVNEVTGWIWNGSTTGIAAKNIGSLNSLYSGRPPWNFSGTRANWKYLLEIPHMNSVDFIESQDVNLPNANSTLTLFHEIDHYWGVKITAQSAVGPREWNAATDPVAWLASCCAHWTWVWEEPGMPGIMYSGPSSNKFNAFDLYFMGLMGYNEAKTYTHQVYEEPRSEPPILHEVNLDSLIYALSLAGSGFYEGDGRRIPDLDPTAQNLRTLLVIVKGKADEFTPYQRFLLEQMAEAIPADWQTATWGRSAMSVGIDENGNGAAPYQVILAQPADLGFVPEEVVYLEWDRSPFAASYHLQVSEKPDFSTTIIDDNQLSSTSLDVPSLTEDTPYYWRVRARNATADWVWSEVRSFVRGAVSIEFGIFVDNTADSGPNSLRDAIEQANAYMGPDTIRFAIPLSDPAYTAGSGTWTIYPQNPLPVITDDSLVIDGFSQADFTGQDNNPNGPEIVINGSQSAQNYWGLRINSSANVISHLVINGFGNGPGIELIDAAAKNNTITDCYLGTGASGMAAVPNMQGIYLYQAMKNTIGGTMNDGGNLISGNSNNGIEFFGEQAAENTISGNFIGTDRTGVAALANGSIGIALYAATHDNCVGGLLPGEGNVISGNTNDGMRIGGDGNVILGNFVGTDSSGTVAVGNAWDGIGIWAGKGNKIGGSEAGAGNLVSGNGKLGIYVRTADNIIVGNKVGTDISGKAGFDTKQASGIGVGSGAKNNTVGPDNIVAFNYWGVQVWADSSVQNTITQNAIFSNETIGIMIRDGGNLELAPPVLTSFANGDLQGTAPAGAKVEIFSDAADQGQYYEGFATADATGNFNWQGTARGKYFTATATDAAGNTSAFSAPLQPTTVVEFSSELPQEFSLQQNYPNPFNPETTIAFALPHPAIVTLKIFNLLGNEIATLLQQPLSAGNHKVTFKAENLSSGVYFYHLQAGEFVQTRKMVLLF